MSKFTATWRASGCAVCRGAFATIEEAIEAVRGSCGYVADSNGRRVWPKSDPSPRPQLEVSA